MDVDVLLARAEIADVLGRYCRAADRGNWDEVRAVYHNDAYDDHGPYKGGPDGLIAHLRGVANKFTFTTHQLGQQVIEVDTDVARAETYCFAWYGRRSRSSGQDWSIAQGLRYLDEFARRDGRWAISRRQVVIDWEHPFPVTHPPRLSEWLCGARGAADPSAQFFAAR